MVARRKRSSRSSFGRYLPAARAGLRVARSALRYGRSFSSSQASRRKFATPHPITGEHDSRTVYRRKRMPRRRRRQWVSFVRRTKAVIQKSLAPSFLIRLRQQTVTSLSGKQSQYSGHVALGVNSFSDTNFQDLSAIRDRVNAFAATGGPVTSWQPDRFQVTGWMCETQITNTGAETAYIDLYYYRTKRDVASVVGGNVFGGITAAWQHGLSSLGTNAPVGGSSLDISDYGVTPFNNTYLPRFITFYRKTRVKLGPGGVTQVETRSGKNYWVNWDAVAEKSMVRNMTEGIYMVAYGTPNLVDTIAAPVSLSCSTNINYTYRVLLAATETGGTTQA